MNIPENIITKYLYLKKRSDAAFTVFRKNPSVENATKHIEASNILKAYCLEAFEFLVAETPEDESVLNAEILANLDTFKTCTHCGSDLLYLTDEDSYIASSDFLPEFPGWCYNCLTEHCSEQACETCTVVTDPTTCSFKGIKESQNPVEEEIE
jgi:hypothetical protein